MLQKDFMSYQIEIKEEKDNKNLTKFHKLFELALFSNGVLLLVTTVERPSSVEHEG